MDTVYLAVGSNIAPRENIPAAIALLREHVTVTAISSVYRTPPTGYLDQDDFYNLALAVQTDRDPEGLRALLDQIEHALGRVRVKGNKAAPRTIDLDIALWGSRAFTYTDRPRRVPHPDILAFAHTAVPLAELAPDYVHPTDGRTLRAIAASLPTDNFVQLDFKPE
ncbi:MAG: 2-amino-4-hydroxy-6-hydroxymethyldihydropteridine diphosphokinase [Chloroflexi bacterium]|nr:2-amino-4-hydroxy-6-hydroxymethyldihydropteridine diphosphokinase [Chloroflexota bacterium]